MSHTVGKALVAGRDRAHATGTPPLRQGGPPHSGQSARRNNLHQLRPGQPAAGRDGREGWAVSHDIGKVLVGMDGRRYDLLTRTPAMAPVLHGLMATGAHGPADDSTGHNEPRPAAPPPGER
ncbi:hypothetical protein ACFYZ2_05950, partial [Streptomyces sviceus]